MPTEVQRKALEAGTRRLKLRLDEETEKRFAPPPQDPKKSRAAAFIKGQQIDESRQGLSPSWQTREQEINLPLTPDGEGLPLTVDGQQPLTPDPPVLPSTVRGSLPPTLKKKPPTLTSDGQGQDTLPLTPNTIPLAPIQWRVLQLLRELEPTGGVYSLNQLAERLNGKKEGVKSAVAVLRKVGAFRSYEVVRRREAQGITFTLDESKLFVGISAEKSRGISIRLPPTVGGRGQVMPLYVCKKNTYIQEEDVKTLLRTAPPGWQIREQSLLQIADLFPSMTALEFRLSLQRLADQAESGKQTIQNPNAWLKAAFEKNGGPLVTEREIEARMQRQKTASKPPRTAEKIEDEDGAVLRRYLATSPEERAEIDHRAQEQARPLLAITGTDKHAGILEEARLEAAKQYFAKG